MAQQHSTACGLLDSMFRRIAHSAAINYDVEKPLPCSECGDLLKNHLFKNAVRQPSPEDKNLKNIPKQYRNQELGELFARKVHGLEALFDAVRQMLRLT